MLKLEIDGSGGAAQAKKVKRSLADVKLEARKAEQSLEMLGRNSTTSLRKTGRAADIAKSKIRGLGAGAVIAATALAAAATAFLRSSGVAYLGFAKNVDETSTLIAGTAEELSYLTQKSKELTATFGGSAAGKANAFYQAISAGVGDVISAYGFLGVANKLAIGGVTDIVTSTDILTTSMNNYGATGLTATDAADTLFQGVKLGKTNIDLLARSIGNVAPSTAALGIEFTELVALLAALTAGGIKTSSSAAGITAALSNIVKPAKEASDLAERIGLNFSASAVEQKGFVGVLRDIQEATGGATEQIANLFGSVEAQKVVFSLLGGDMKRINSAMIEMETRAGSTEIAYEKISKKLSGRLNIQLGIFNTHLVDMGQVIIRAVVPGLEFLNRHIDIILTSLTLAGVALAVAFAPVTGVIIAVVAGLALITSSLREIDPATYSFAAGTDELVKSMSAEFEQSQSLATIIATGTTLSLEAAEHKLGEAKARYTHITAIHDEQIALVKASEEYQKQQKIITKSTNTISFLNRYERGDLKDVNLEGGEIFLEYSDVNELQTELQKAQAAADALLSSNGSGIFNAQLEKSRANIAALELGIANAQNGQVTVGPFVPGGGDGGAGIGGVNKLKEAYERLKSSLDPVYAATQDYTVSLKTLNDALASGNITPDQYRNTLGQLNDDLKEFNREQQKGVSGAAEFFGGIVTGATTAKNALKNLFASVASNLVNRGFEGLIGGLFGGGGTASGFLDLIFSADGNAFDKGQVVPFANGGIIDRATPFGLSGGRTGIAGEAGPEGVLPLQRGPNGQLGVTNFGGQSDRAMHVIINYSIDARGTNNEAVDRLRAEQQNDRAALKTNVVRAIKEAQQDRIL